MFNSSIIHKLNFVSINKSHMQLFNLYTLNQPDRKNFEYDPLC